MTKKEFKAITYVIGKEYYFVDKTIWPPTPENLAYLNGKRMELKFLVDNLCYALEDLNPSFDVDKFKNAIQKTRETYQ